MVLAAAARVAETVKPPWQCGSKGVLIPQLGHDASTWWLEPDLQAF